MEPTSDTTIPTTEQSMAPQPVMVKTSYHRKQRLMKIIGIALLVIAIIAIGWWLWKKFYKKPYADPQQVLTSLAASSQPVQKTSEQRAADMQTLEQKPKGQPLPPAMTAETRLQMFNNLDK